MNPQHWRPAIAAADCDLLLIIGASATVDRGDVIPAALVAAGGVVDRLGMPVDPGNLLCLGRLGAMPVIGLPGCARSPKRNGFDIVLERLVAGLAVTGDDIAADGRRRPAPRSRTPRAARDQRRGAGRRDHPRRRAVEPDGR